MIINKTVLKQNAAFSHPASADMPVDQHALGQSILLHLLPGAIATIVYVFSASVLTRLGFPSITALYLPMILAVILIELGYLLYRGQKKNGSLSLKGIVDFQQPVRWWVYIAFPLLILVWGILVTALVSPIDNLFLNRLFGWLPDWYALRSLLQIKEMYPRTVILATAGCALILNGIAGPIVEELYFRGHLLPRLSRFGRWAPLLNVILFSLYHLWTPWMFFSRVILLVPMVYLVWWKRNIYIGIIAHCLLNLIGTLVLFAQLLG
jgi:membrane protease YdiL (CAAX protease family)